MNAKQHFLAGGSEGEPIANRRSQQTGRLSNGLASYKVREMKIHNGSELCVGDARSLVLHIHYGRSSVSTLCHRPNLLPLQALRLEYVLAFAVHHKTTLSS